MLYPPYIESKLPAQYGGTLKIPFRLNRTQSEIDINGKTFTALIKTVTTNKIMGTISTIHWEKENGEYFANIQLDEIELTIGQYYKIQLAYEDSTLYSSVGIFKYTSTPTVECDFNSSSFVLTGKYQSNDPTEKVYMYKFDCWNSDEILIETSGWKIHNSLNDTITTESQNTYIPQSAFNIEDASFSVKYSIKTINDIELSSDSLPIELEWNELLDNEVIAQDIDIVHNKEFGLIKINYKQSETSMPFLVRHSNRGFELIKLMINANTVENIISYMDYNLEQGHSYTYYLCNNSMEYQQLNEAPIKVDFEDMFLQDKDFILRIRYNPKMQSFKTVIMENKIETLGSQYPIFLRNGNINYKEFSISGLLVAPEPFNTVKRQQTNSINSIVEFTEADNIYRERVYKLEVLDWLNNSKPKLFRSSTEGNYVVRLMNVSLSPEVQLGRKLHTFSATAYEIAPYNTQSLIDNNIIEG